MSYVKTTWQDGDVITTEKLNNIESGIESSLSNELLALYKTMAGKDWPYDPNPTDAEVIDKIAADASGSGGSGSAGRVIDLSTLEKTTETLPGTHDTMDIYSGYEAGLSAQDFVNAWISWDGSISSLQAIQGITVTPPKQGVNLKVPNAIGSTSVTLSYLPETGEFTLPSSGGEK